MDKLGYTFYPKDWWTSDTFFKLPPELRYLYLEIISMMYMNDGYWKASRIELYKRFGVEVGEKGWEVLESLFIVDGEIWSHDSVKKRIDKNSYGGKKRAESAVRDSSGKFQPNSPSNDKKPAKQANLPSPNQPIQPNRIEENRIEENLNRWQMWADLISDGNDPVWDQMRCRKTKKEIDSFLSVAVRNQWKMDTQHSFRIALKGFSSMDTKKEPANWGKIQ